jgi:hypothetical protein
MTFISTQAAEVRNWVQRVREALQTRGYYYDPAFYIEDKGLDSVIAAAQLLGHVHVPTGSAPGRPIISTQPNRAAPPWRPFDRRTPIRWHNDFSTRPGRPELSLSWIIQEDPGGPKKGAWLVASTAEVLRKLNQTRGGKRLVMELARHAEPFGYRDAGGWRPFRVIIRPNSKLTQSGLRFYGPALEDGAWLRFGSLPARTHEIVACVEHAADAVREVLPAKTGSLLIVHNSLSLHDRSPQTVNGPKENRRRAVLCFVDRLHRPLTD